jgi:hypothetical protein
MRQKSEKPAKNNVLKVTFKMWEKQAIIEF